MRFPRWLCFPLSLALLLAAAIWPISNPLKGLDDKKMEAHAPFWLASHDAGAVIFVNNVAPQGFAFRLRLHGPDGSLLHSQERFADSAASLTIPVSDWLDGSVEAGYAVLEYPAESGGYLPAQMSCPAALNSAIQTEFQIYDAEQETILKDGENESERLAYGKSDPIAPKFVYQNCSRY